MLWYPEQYKAIMWFDMVWYVLVREYNEQEMIWHGEYGLYSYGIQ